MRGAKLTMGIDDATRSPVLGSYWLALVAVTSQQRRKYASLNIKDSKLLNAKQIEKIVKVTSNGLAFIRVAEMTPREIDRAIWDRHRNLNTLVMEKLVGLLNEIPRFWKHKIIIDNGEKDARSFERRFQQVIALRAANLKKEGVKTTGKNWKVKHHADKDYWVCSLASIYAKYASNIDYEQLRAVWGEIGSGTPGHPETINFIKEHPDCPIIRRSWSTYRKLIESGDIPPLKKEEEDE